MNDAATILVVDDDRAMVSLLCDVLREAGYEARSANSGAEALVMVREDCPDLLISDVRMSGMSGHQLQAELHDLVPDLPVVIITAFGSIESAVESMKRGAADYITKPFRNDEFLLVVSRVLENRQLRQEIRRLRGDLARSYGIGNIIAADPQMKTVLRKLEPRYERSIIEEVNKSMKLIRYAKGEYSLTVEDVIEHERPPMITIPEYRERFKLPRG